MGPTRIVLNVNEVKTMRNQEKMSLLAEGLSTLTPIEALAVVGTINHMYGITVSRGVVHMLTESVKDQEGAQSAVVGKLKLVRCGEKKIQVIKLLREHLNTSLTEAKELADSAPQFLCNKFQGNKLLDGSQKLLLAKALQSVGAGIEFA